MKTSLSDENDIVITGLSGRFPESDSVNELRDNLFAGLDLVTEHDERWPKDFWDLPRRCGKLKDLSKFDANLFNISDKVADLMDPQIRILLEVVFEAICDSGLQLEDVRGTQTGIFLGSIYNEIDRNLNFQDIDYLEYKQIFVGWLAHVFDINGHSALYETACSSSLAALTEAYLHLKHNLIQTALVTSCNIFLSPSHTLEFLRLGLLGRDGRCRFLDQNGTGYAKGEAVVAMVFQKKKAAKRIYATVLTAMSAADGYKPEGITFPKWETQYDLLKKAYSSCGLDTNKIDCMEAHGTGTQVGDTQEMRSLSQALKVETRSKPLLVGSIKTNIGHCEASSGLCSLVKVLIAFENKCIPKNLHFESPNKCIESLVKGQILPILKNTIFKGGVVGLSNFGFGCSNNHVIVCSYEKEPTSDSFQVFHNDLSRLILFCGRTEDGVKEALKYIQDLASQESLTKEFLALINEQSKMSLETGMITRGFLLLDSKRADKSISSVSTVSTKRPPLFFVFSGLGCQFRGMGNSFLKIPIFAKSIQESALIVKECLDIDLVDMMTNKMTSINIENSMLCLTALSAFQMAFIDFLLSLGLVPDGYIGHSFGELCCAYLDGSMTKKQVLLTAAAMYQCTEASGLSTGLMAVVGLPREAVEPRCTPNVYVACNNSQENVTIAGEENELLALVKQLRSENVFVREVKSCRFAFHCPLTKAFEDKLYQRLCQIMPEPRSRSSKWISTVKESEGKREPISEYFTRCVARPVLFYEATQRIPSGSVLFEISPRSFISAILKRSLASSSMTLMSLNRANVDDVHQDLKDLLGEIGKFYELGYSVSVEKLYPKVVYPVPRGTPSLSSIIKLNHSKSRLVRKYPHFFLSRSSSNQKSVIDISSESNRYLQDYQLAGNIVLPSSAFIYLVWSKFTEATGSNPETLSVQFEDIVFVERLVLNRNDKRSLQVDLVEESKRTKFSVKEIKDDELVKDVILVHGCVFALDETSDDSNNKCYDDNNNIVGYALQASTNPLSSKDVYKEFQRKGFQVGKHFKNIQEFHPSNLCGKLKWTRNWITFLDTVFQFGLLIEKKLCATPKNIESLKINLKTFLPASTAEDTITCVGDKFTKGVFAAGVEIKNLETSSVEPVEDDLAFKVYKFFPYFEETTEQINCLRTFYESLEALVNVAIENISQPTFCKTIGVVGSKSSLNYLWDTQISNVHDSYEYKLLNWPAKEFNGPSLDMDPQMILPDAKGLSVIMVCIEPGTSSSFLKSIAELVMDGGFLLCFSNTESITKDMISTAVKETSFLLVSQRIYKNGGMFLLKKPKKDPKEELSSYASIVVSGFQFNWMDRVTTEGMDTKENKPLLLFSGDSLSGLLGIYNQLQIEPAGGHRQVRCLFESQTVSSQKQEDICKAREKIMKLHLAQNVLLGNKWGSYQHVSVSSNYFGRIDSGSFRAQIHSTKRGSKPDWVQVKESNWIKLDTKSKTQLCQVSFAVINRGDVYSVSSTKSSLSKALGMEFSGTLANGAKVMGIVPSGALSTTVDTLPDLLWSVPSNWTLAEAATIPLAYSTAYYALVVRARMTKEQNVLIHCGADTLGLAAISICISLDSSVFTTVQSEEQLSFLKAKFPKLDKRRICLLHESNFEEVVLRETQGRGVDIILNSMFTDTLAGDTCCVANHGKLLQVGKVYSEKYAKLGLSVFLKNATFHGISMESLLSTGIGGDKPSKASLKERKLIQSLVNLGISTGVVRPLPYHVYPAHEIEQALEFETNTKRIGSVLVKIREEHQMAPNQLRVIQRPNLEAEKCYLIFEGLESGGLKLIELLVELGARKILLISKELTQDEYHHHHQWFVEELKNSGVDIKLIQRDLSEEDVAEDFIGAINETIEIGGIFVASPSQCDENMQNLEQCWNYLIQLTKSLDIVSRKNCKSIDFFVTFCIQRKFRNLKQRLASQFCFSTMARICERRQEDSSPGLSLRWIPKVMESNEKCSDKSCGSSLKEKTEAFDEIPEVCLESLSASTFGQLLCSSFSVVSLLEK